jgi:hypothetical protein
LMDPPAPIGLDADDLFGEGKRIVVKDALRQLGRDADQNCRY